MPVISIIGAGPLAGALAQKLGTRGRVREVRLIDPQDSVARGKALDIVQSAPVEQFSTSVTAGGSLLQSAGSDVVVLADAVDGQEHAGEPGLAIVRQLEKAGIRPSLVFAGASQRELMMRSAQELRVDAARLVGSAPFALAASLRALCAVIADTSGVEISLSVLGVPPRHAVVAWEEATISGQPLTATLAAHDIAALQARLPGLWPPGPYNLASAAARVVEALCFGSRRRYCCFVETSRPGRIAAMPVELGRGGITRIVEPTLTTLERTALETAVGE